MVSTRPAISKSSSPCTNPLVTVPRAPITICILVIFMFHSFFNFLARSTCLSLFSYTFNFTLWSARTEKSTILQVPFFLSITIRSGRLAEIWWSVLSQNPQSVSAFNSLGLIIIIIIYSLQFFHISVSWWVFTGVWVTASLLKSPGLVSGFWPFSAMLLFR